MTPGEYGQSLASAGCSARFRNCCLSVRGTLYQGRTAAGGYGQRLVLDGISADIAFEHPCAFLLQRDAEHATALESDRQIEAHLPAAH
jgi:hypothetical protein